MGKQLRQQPFLVQLGDLILIELTNWRWSWRAMAVLGMLTPLGVIVAIKVLLADADARTLGYVLTGNAVLSLMFENQNRVGDHVVFMRFHGTLDYFTSLPIKRYTLILAIVLAFLTLSLPSVFVVVTVGALLLGVDLSPSPVLLIVVPLCALPMAAIGALVGVLARTSSEALSMGLLVTFVMAGLGAVIVPPERVPDWLSLLGRLSPATYAASGLRQALLGPVTVDILWDLSFLIGFSTLTLWLVGSRMDWRQD